MTGHRSELKALGPHDPIGRTVACLRARVLERAGECASGGDPADRSVGRKVPPTPDDICHAVEQNAAENALPVEFFARVIWQESRFNARAVSFKGAEGIAQFMPRTADWQGLANPFDPIEALRHSAAICASCATGSAILGWRPPPTMQARAG